MITRLRAMMIALMLFPTCSVLAQQPAERPPSSSAPNTQSPQVPSNDKPKPAQNERATAGEVPVLNPTQPPKDQKPGGDRAKGDKAEGSDVVHERNETILADFTRVLAVATLLLMIATGGLWWETRKLAKQAVESSKDTKRSIKIAKRSAKSSSRSAKAAVDALQADRAWIYYVENQVQYSKDGLNEKGEISKEAYGICANWKNGGKVPAVNMALAAQGTFIELDKEVPHFDLTPPADRRTSMLGPGASANSQTWWIYGEELERMRNGQLIFIYYSLATYGTTLNPKANHVTEVTLQIIIDGTTIDILGKRRPIFATRLIGSQNTAS